MRSVPRILTAVGVAVATVTCADQSMGNRTRGLARLAIAPAFVQAPAGGPDIEVGKVRGVLRKQNGNDSSVAEAALRGDSAILEFTNVVVTGDNANYALHVRAFDKNNVVVFEGSENLTLVPGDNKPAAPTLAYAAPDANVTSLDIPVAEVQLDWAGAKPGDVSCLNRSPSPTAKTEQTLTVIGKTSAGAEVPNVRVGWTSRDPSVATVDAGVVKARCANKSTYVVARTFLDQVDSVKVSVTAPPFSLMMTPDSVNLPRNDTIQLTALVVDETGNPLPTTGVTWSSSDDSRAAVTATGRVIGKQNGRVLITATSGDRRTVAVVLVVRPVAARVAVVPQRDTLAVGMVRGYVAKAFDRDNRVIGDATGFTWRSSKTVAATVNTSTGVVSVAASTTDSAYVFATLDGKTDSLALQIVPSLPPGAIKGKIVNGATDAPIAGATIAGRGGSATTASDGTFVLGGVSAGDDLTLTASGFATVTFYDAPAFPGQTIQVPTLPMSSSAGPLGGRVINALSGSPVSEVTVSVYTGINAGPSPRRPDPTLVARVLTNSSGTFSVPNVPAGAYTFVATLPGYSEAIGAGVPNKASPDIFIAPSTASGLYAVVTWGNCGTTNVPCNLEAHATGRRLPPDTGRFNVFSGARAYVSVDTIAALDLEASQGKGPEVASIRSAAPAGGYRFYVRNASAQLGAISRGLADSADARVDVFLNNKVVATFFPPAAQQGNLWEVFKFDGARVFPVNQIMYTPTAAFTDDNGAAPIDITGSWRGMVTLDAGAGSQEVTFTLTRSGPRVEGTWQITGDPNITPVRGTLFGTHLELGSAQPVSSTDDCYKFPWTWTFNVTSSGLVVASVVGTDCVGNGTGGHTSLTPRTGGTGTLAKLP